MPIFKAWAGKTHSSRLSVLLIPDGGRLVRCIYPASLQACAAGVYPVLQEKKVFWILSCFPNAVCKSAAPKFRIANPKQRVTHRPLPDQPSPGA
jgi:hypothetical protein